MKKWFAAMVIVALAMFCLTTTTFAATGGNIGKGTPATTHSKGLTAHVKPLTSVISCSGYGCDNVYAYPSNSNSQGSNCGGSFVGWFSGEPQWSKIYYSSACGTNFAYVTSSPDGSAIVDVTLFRRPPGGSTAGYIDSTLNGAWCTSGFTIPPTDHNSYCDADHIPNGAHSWNTNMLYAPVDQVMVRVITAQNRTYYSYWH